MPLRSLLLLALLLVALLPSCTSGESLGSNARASLVVRDGMACAAGCSLDAPVLVGSEIVADVLTTLELDRLEARAIDAVTASAWIEPVRLCCGAGVGASCHRMEPAEVACEGDVTMRPRVVVRALRVGETAIELRDGDALIAAVPVRVEDAIEVNVVPVPSGTDAAGDLVWIDGRAASLALRAGQVMRAWLVAIAPDGTRLLASDGPSARASDARIVRVGPASGVCSGEVANGPLVQLQGVAGGQTTLVVRAGSASTTLPVVVSGTCEGARIVTSEVTSDATCESDADCVPAACCHASACVAASDAAACEDEACTLECREGTLDCGGRCLCLEGRCAAYVPASDVGCDAPLDPPF